MALISTNKHLTVNKKLMGIYQCVCLVKQNKEKTRWDYVRSLDKEESDEHLSVRDREDIDRRSDDFYLGRWFYKSVKEVDRWVLYYISSTY